MGIRRETENRLTLYRSCGVCGKSFTTTAASPWMRQMVVDGKQKTTYFCSRSCFYASYKHKGFVDGKAEQRRTEREAKRDISTKNRLYYERHREKEKARAKARYWADPEAVREANRYQRKKKKLLEKEVVA